MLFRVLGLNAVVALIRQEFATLRDLINTLRTEVKIMSDTVQSELAAEKAALADMATTVHDAVAKIAADAAALASGGATPEQLAEMAANTAAIQEQTAALKAALAPASSGGTTGADTA